MSRENVTRFIAFHEGGGAAEGLPGEPTVDDVINYARTQGFEFSQADLRSVLKELVYGARSLPKPWGWPIARDLGLVHRT